MYGHMKYVFISLYKPYETQLHFYLKLSKSNTIVKLKYAIVGRVLKVKVLEIKNVTD